MDINMSLFFTGSVLLSVGVCAKVYIYRGKIRDLESKNKLLEHQNDVYKDQMNYLMKERSDLLNDNQTIVDSFEEKKKAILKLKKENEELLEDNAMLKRLNEQYQADAFEKAGFKAKDEESNKVDLKDVFDTFLNKVVTALKNEIADDEEE